MVSRLRLCRAIQSARASASATVVIASTSTASFSPKIKVDVIGSKPSASPKGFGRSPTIAFPGAVKTFTFSVLDAIGAVTRVVSFTSFASSIWYSFRSQSERLSNARLAEARRRIHWTNVSSKTKVLARHWSHLANESTVSRLLCRFQNARATPSWPGEFHTNSDRNRLRAGARQFTNTIVQYHERG